jgi:hypothetical protein
MRPKGPPNPVWTPRPALPRRKSLAGDALERAIAKGIEEGHIKLASSAPAEPAKTGAPVTAKAKAKKPGAKQKYDREVLQQVIAENPDASNKQLRLAYQQKTGKLPSEGWIRAQAPKLRP